MNVKITLTATRYLIIAVALLHTSHGQTTLLQVTYNFNNMPELVSLECLSDDIFRAGARYTFMDPERRVENSIVAAGRSYEFTIHPTNESLITCTIDNVESEPVKVVAIPLYTAGIRFINQYVYSDSAVADIVCPFESGRLGEPVEISWSFAGSGGTRLGPITNATSGAYWLEEEGNRILHVNISTLGSLGYHQCAGSVEICERRTSCVRSIPSPSPTFVVWPIDRLSVTEPVSVTVDQFDSATFTCIATGSGDLIIEWTCSDGSNCDMSNTISSNNGSVTRTLVIIGATSNLTVTCNVMQNLINLTSGESASVEVRRPLDFVPIEREQRTAQLIFTPLPTTVTTMLSDPPTDVSPTDVSPSPEPISGQETIIILTLVLLFIIIAIIILIVCICSIYCYHCRKKIHLGQRLRRIFNGDPASYVYDVPTEIHDTQLIPNDREVTIAHPINHETRMVMQENSAYGTDITIAPEIAAERNVAYGHTSRSDANEIGIGYPGNGYGLESRTDDTTSTKINSPISPLCPIMMNLPETMATAET